MFLDKKFCDVSQQLGILSLGATDRLVKLIGNLYWFTIEFGLVKENDKMKLYGGGIASSIAEIENFQNSKYIKLDLNKSFPDQQPLIESLQESFYYIDSFDELLDQLMEVTSTIKKPFKYSFDKDSEHLYLDRALETFDEK